jgi:transcription elongation factor Elf1
VTLLPYSAGTHCLKCGYEDCIELWHVDATPKGWLSKGTPEHLQVDCENCGATYRMDIREDGKPPKVMSLTMSEFTREK